LLRIRPKQWYGIKGRWSQWTAVYLYSSFWGSRFEITNSLNTTFLISVL